MNSEELCDRWAERFGLARVPLFEAREVDDGGRHTVLLDGGYGSFALSESQDRIWEAPMSAEWSWSSNVPHHVTVTTDEVGVVRWDKSDGKIFTRSSVERHLDTFYDYLVNDRVRSNRRVVDYMVTLFRKVRSLVADAGIEDSRSVDAYLGILARAISRRSSLQGLQSVQTGFDLWADTHDDVLKDLSEQGIERILEDCENPWLGGNPPLRFHPVLAVRHAGSELFQEAHFELVRTSDPNLFGDFEPARSSGITRGGAHFTPPALARILVERTLREVDDLHSRSELVVLDPACGSAVFLHETLRTLRRLGYCGTVRLIGWDISPVAVSMARFVLTNALNDWQPEGGGSFDVSVADSLSVPLPSADVVLMNPPFVSWPALTAKQREQMKDVLGSTLRGRADLSMAFLTMAVRSIKRGGVVGSLLPASLLTAERARAWRHNLLDEADLTFLGTLGDFGLFIHAMVQVATTVFTKRSRDGKESDVAVGLVAGNDRYATGNALRELRKVEQEDWTRADEGWQIFPISVPNLKQRPTWRLVPPDTERILANLLESGRALPVGAMFDVRQGVLTGMNSVFLLNWQERNALPKSEWRWFREAIVNNSISGGRVDSTDFVFYPYGPEGLELTSENEVAEAVPHFYETVLQPNRKRLAARSGHVRQRREDWWGLTWPREWERVPSPRIATKYFGGRGGFVPDVEARYVVVQGYAWLPKEGTDRAFERVDDSDTIGSDDVLYAYASILNSRQFERLLGVYSPQIAGGQFNLSPSFVRHIPLPDLAELWTDEGACETVLRLAELGNADEPFGISTLNEIDDLTGRLYGIDSLDES